MVYTKGKWKCFKQHDTFINDKSYKGGYDSDTAYFLDFPENEFHSDLSETDGNARLIENAPCMYSVLKEVIADLELFCSRQGPGPDKRLENLKTILARIEKTE